MHSYFFKYSVQIALIRHDRAILFVFDNLTWAYEFQIALTIIWIFLQI